MMRPDLRPRILVISSSAALRARLAADLAPRYDVKAVSAWSARDLSGEIGLAVLDERDRPRAAPPSMAWPILPVREAFEPDLLLERIETHLELARLRAKDSASGDPAADRDGGSRERLAFLVSASDGMANALSLDDVLRSLCDAAVPRLAQWCTVTLLEEGRFVARAARHPSPEKKELLKELGRRYSPQNDRRHPIHRVLATGRSEFVSEVPAAFGARLASSERHLRLIRELSPASYMCVPLRARGKPIGALFMATESKAAPLSPADLILAEQLGARAGSSIERARLHQAVEEELATRLRAEAALRRQEQEQALILDTVKAMIWFKDASNRILRCNRAAAQWAGRTPEQITGRKVEEIFPAARARAYYKQDLSVIAAGRPRIGELEEIRMRGGAKRWVQRDTYPYRNERGEIIGVVIIAVDVTRLKHAENMAAAKERAEREFIANVSHEFRTPVAAIKGFVQTLQSGAWRIDADRERFLGIIESNADRLDGLVGDLITLSAIEGGGPREAAPLELGPLARDCARKVLARARRKGISLGVSVPRGLRAKGERAQLALALEHLLDNAVKFTPPGGAVRVRARGQGGEARIWVEDSGIGIPRAELPRVFERFFRVAKGSSPRNPGLGLHLVKKLIESYGGTVSVKSRLAHGTSFRVALPLAPAPSRRRRPAAAARAS